MRTDLVISNPPDFRGILPVRSKLARITGSDLTVPEKAAQLKELQRRTIGDAPHACQESSSFDANGEFLPPLSFGAAVYKAVEKNVLYASRKGANVSVYA